MGLNGRGGGRPAEQDGRRGAAPDRGVAVSAASRQMMSSAYDCEECSGSTLFRFPIRVIHNSFWDLGVFRNSQRTNVDSQGEAEVALVARQASVVFILLLGREFLPVTQATSAGE